MGQTGIILFAIFLSISYIEGSTENPIYLIFSKKFTEKREFQIVIQTTGLKEADALLAAEFRNNTVFERIERAEEIIMRKSIDPGNHNVNNTNFTLTFFRNNMCSRHVVKLHKFTKKFFTFLQLTKPTYKPGDKIEYRVIVLDNFLKPYQTNQQRISLVNPNGIEIGFYTKKGTASITGIIQDHFKLSDKAELGNWTIEVKIDNYNFTISKSFLVQEYNLPLYEFLVKTEPHVSLFKDIINVVVDARYSFGEFVKGHVKIEVHDVLDSKKYGQKFYETKPMFIEGIETFNFSISKDINLRQLRSDPHLLDVKVIFTDTFGSSKVKNAEIYVHQKLKCEVEVVNMQSYVKNGPISFDVKVRDIFGYKDSSSSSVVVRAMELSGSNHTQRKLIQNGVANFLFGNLKTQKIIFEISFSNVLHSYGVECTKVLEVHQKSLQQNDNIKLNNLDVSYSPLSPKLNDVVKVTVHSSKPLHNCFYLVHNRFGIIQSDYEERENDVECNLFITVTKEMLPNTKVYVFGSLERFGILTYGEFDLNFDQLSENFLDVEIRENNIQPGKNVALTVSSKPNSDIFFMAMDKKLTYLANGNDLTPNDFSLAFNTKEQDIYVIKEDFSHMDECTDEEKMMFENLQFSEDQDLQSSDTAFNWKDQIQFTNYDGDGGDYDDVELSSLREHFPETWLFEHRNIGNDGILNFDVKVPHSITSWIVSAFSMNKQHGFALAEKRELKVSMKFFLSVNSPYISKIGEIVELEVILFNFLESHIDTNVKLEVDELQIVSQSTRNRSCHFMSLNKKHEVKSVIAISGRGTRVTFKIRALNVGVHRVKIFASGSQCPSDKNCYDSLIETLRFERSGVQKFSHNHEIINNIADAPLNYTPLYLASSEDDKCKSITFEFYADTISKSLQRNDDYRPNLGQCGEQIASMFSREAITYDFLKNVRHEYDKANKIKRILEELYQRMLKLFDKEGKYKLWFDIDNSGGVWLTAHVVTVLGNAMNKKVISENNELILKALRYIDKNKNKLPMPGQKIYKWNQYGTYYKMPCGFIKDGERKRSYDIDHWLTTTVIQAFLQNKERIGNEFDDTIAGGMNYIEMFIPQFDSCSVSFAAYTFTLNDATRISGLNITKNLKNRRMNDKVVYIFDDSNVVDKANIMISSYVVLTLLQFNDVVSVKNAEPIIKWLVDVRDVDGQFIEPYDTAIALSALVKYAEKFPEKNSNFELNILDVQKDKLIDSITVKQDDSFIKEFNPDTLYRIEGHGKGVLHINDICEQYVKATTSDHLNLTVNAQLVDNDEAGLIEVCLIVDGGRNMGNEMTMVEIPLQSGFIFNEKFDKIYESNFGEQKIVKEIDTHKTDTVVILYLQRNEISEESYNCVKIKVRRKSVVHELKTEYVKAYLFDAYEKYNIAPYTFAPKC